MTGNPFYRQFFYVFGCRDVNISVRPFLDLSYKPPMLLIELESLLLEPMANGWQSTAIEYQVADSPALNCKLAQFFEVNLYAAEGYDVQIMDVQLIGFGSILGLEVSENPNSEDDPNKRQRLRVGIITGSVLASIGSVSFLLCVGMVWWHRSTRRQVWPSISKLIRLPASAQVTT